MKVRRMVLYDRNTPAKLCMADVGQDIPWPDPRDERSNMGFLREGNMQKTTARKRMFGMVVALSTALTSALMVIPDGAGAAAGNGVTSSTITIGVPYIDLAALASEGVKLNQGSWPDAFNALVSNLNSHGGIDGRKVQIVFGSVNPAEASSAQAVCTQVTEDNAIFVAMSPYQPECYVVTHHIPTINASLPGGLPTSAAPNFTLTAPPSAFDPLQLAVYAKEGLFKGKKVAIVGTEQNDLAELGLVQSILQKLHVHVVQKAVETALATDQAAVQQEDSDFVQKFQSEGVNEVVAVGSESSAWPVGLTEIQSNFNPPWIATLSSALSSVIGGGSATAKYLSNVTTAEGTLSTQQYWTDPLVQQCVHIIRKAYPSDTIDAPSAGGNTSDHTYVSPEGACQDLALFKAIAGAAGKNLTVASFTKAGYRLRNVVLPGSGGLVSFAPGRPYAVGPVYVGKYNAASNQLVFSTRNAASG
jgi:hypothetical protein